MMNVGAVQKQIKFGISSDRMKNTQIRARTNVTMKPNRARALAGAPSADD